MHIVSMTEFGKLPALHIAAPDGAQAIVTLYGAHLVSWKTADGRERLFCSTRSALDGSRAIRGGMPVIFPQFGERGNGLRHGFARIVNWRSCAGSPDGADDCAELGLTHSDLPASLAAAWPFEFELRLRVALHASGLNLSLKVRNTGQEPFPFSAALHAYYLVDQLEHAGLDGLQRVRFSDQEQNVALQEEATLQFGDNLDRIYYQLPGPLTLNAGAGTLRLEQEGFTDAVVWNPGAADAAALADMADQEYRRFICIEPALIEPDVLAAGAAWTGRLRVCIPNSIP